MERVDPNPWRWSVDPFRQTMRQLADPTGGVLDELDALERWTALLLDAPMPVAATLASPFADLAAPALTPVTAAADSGGAFAAASRLSGHAQAAHRDRSSLAPREDRAQQRIAPDRERPDASGVISSSTSAGTPVFSLRPRGKRTGEELPSASVTPGAPFATQQEGQVANRQPVIGNGAPISSTASTAQAISPDAGGHSPLAPTVPNATASGAVSAPVPPEETAGIRLLAQLTAALVHDVRETAPSTASAETAPDSASVDALSPAPAAASNQDPGAIPATRSANGLPGFHGGALTGGAAVVARSDDRPTPVCRDAVAGSVGRARF